MGAPSPFYDFFFLKTPPSKRMSLPPWGTMPLKTEASPAEKQDSSLKSEVPFQEMILRRKKTLRKSETAINTCVSLIKQISHIPHKWEFPLRTRKIS